MNDDPLYYHHQREMILQKLREWRGAAIQNIKTLYTNVTYHSYFRAFASSFYTSLGYATGALIPLLILLRALGIGS